MTDQTLLLAPAGWTGESELGIAQREWLSQCQHDPVNQDLPGVLRLARGDDIRPLLAMWELLFDEVGWQMTTSWKKACA